jgi:hypothetical protein
MRHAGNISVEWGYVAPASSFTHTARLIAVAVAVGAIAGAAVVFSLVDRQGVEASEGAVIAARVPASGATNVAQVEHEKTGRAPQAQRLATSSIGQQTSPLAPPPLVSPPKGSTANDSGTTSTTQHSASVAALAESPRMTDVPLAQPGVPGTQAPLAADAGAAQNGANAQKKSPAKPNTASRSTQFPRGPLALLRSFGFRGEN